MMERRLRPSFALRSLLLLAAIVCAVAGCRADSWEDTLAPRRVEGYGAVPLQWENNAYVLSVKVKDQKTRLVLATGRAVAVAVEPDLAEAARVRATNGAPSWLPFGTLGPTVLPRVHLLSDESSSLTSGPVLSAVPARLVRPSLPRLAAGTQGEVGWPLFLRSRVVLDFPEQRLHLLQSDPTGHESGSRLPLRVDQAGLAVPVMLSGADGSGPLFAVINTLRADPFGFPESVVEQWGTVGEMIEWPDGTGRFRRLARIDAEVRVGPVTWVRPIIEVLSDGDLPYVGVGALSRLRLTIESQLRYLLVSSPHGDTVPPVRLYSFGFGWSRMLKASFVSWVAPRGDAANSGLKVMDRLYTIDGVPVELLTSDLTGPMLWARKPVTVEYQAGPARVRTEVRPIELLPLSPSEDE